MESVDIATIRLYERLAISVIIFGIGIIAIVIFAWKGKEMAVETGGLIGRINASLNMAIFVFAILVAYAWANMANPISVELSQDDGRGGDVIYAGPLGGNNAAVTGRFIGLGGLGDQVTGHFQQLFVPFANSQRPRATSISASEAAMLVDLAVKLTALRERGEFEPDLFSGLPDFYDVQRTIEAAYADTQ